MFRRRFELSYTLLGSFTYELFVREFCSENTKKLVESLPCDSVLKSVAIGNCFKLLFRHFVLPVPRATGVTTGARCVALSLLASRGREKPPLLVHAHFQIIVRAVMEAHDHCLVECWVG